MIRLEHRVLVGVSPTQESASTSVPVLPGDDAFHWFFNQLVDLPPSPWQSGSSFTTEGEGLSKLLSCSTETGAGIELELQQFLPLKSQFCFSMC